MTTVTNQVVSSETPVPDLPIKDEPSTGSSVLDWLLVQLKSFALTIWDIISDFLLFIIDILMSAGIVLLDGFASTLELVNLSNYISGMPSDAIFVMNAVGLGEAIGIIMLAGTARLFMQLIPFVRLGS